MDVACGEDLQSQGRCVAGRLTAWWRQQHGDSPMPAFRNVLAMIGNTPLVEVARIDTGKCRLFLKLENQNPGGSIKDRIALSMIEAAEADGRLKAGGTIIEATAGNTGLGLALVAAQ